MHESNRSEFGKVCGHPQRICWAVAQAGDKRSICPIGWKMWTSISPPIMAISVAPSRFTHGLIVSSGEFVLAWPGADLAEATMLCGTRSGRDIDKFKECSLTPGVAKCVNTPLVAECLFNLECRLAGGRPQA